MGRRTCDAGERMIRRLFGIAALCVAAVILSIQDGPLWTLAALAALAWVPLVMVWRVQNRRAN